jgi:hypothetical protein
MAHRHVRLALLGSAALACLMAGMLVGVLAAGGSVAEVLAVRTRTVSAAVTRVQPTTVTAAPVTRVQPTTVTATAVRSVTVAKPPGHGGPKHRHHRHHRG